MRRFDNPFHPAPVIHTRGEGCAELADLLSIVPSIRVKGDLAEACQLHRTDLVVGRRLTSGLEIASQVVPNSFDSANTEWVVAAVSGGPHSPLAARVARRLGESMGVKSLMVCAYMDDETQVEALSWVERLYQEVPGIEYRMIEARDADGIIEQLPEKSALVIGAPGGSWLQRTFFGQGARLRKGGSAGVMVVRAVPERVFQAMADPVFVGGMREVGDILRIHGERILAVADRAKLIGIVDRGALEASDPLALVRDVMDEPLSVPVDASVDEALALVERFGQEPIPVTDEAGHLVGSISFPT
ncbi:MAG TPA: CBS domain-containing protein [Acidimicrobiia bacterium]|jgi:CBS domain-containing protein